MPSNRWKHAKNLFALIIGIDKYKHVSRLSLAVSDAVAMESFVHEDLGVPKHRIKTLFDKEATRKRILKALDDLQENEGIKRDDPIFIFFAGHGCAIKSEQLQGWGAGDRKEIQAICPQDVKVWGTPNRAESPIPDFILASLINKLSRKKGNNITVIFDCCHAASGTREDVERGVRCVTFYGKLPPDINDDLGVIDDTRGQLIPPGFLDQHSRSHVLLAACGANEKAREENGHGLFTKALLKTLRNPGIDKISFIEFMKQMPHVNGQTVQCEGHFKHRRIFSTRIRESSPHFFPIEKAANKYYKIGAGSVHGVTKDSLFDIFTKASPISSNNKRLGRLRVENVYQFHAEAVLEGGGRREVVNPAFALQVRGGTALHVYFSSHLLKTVRLDELLNLLNDDIIHVKRKEEADFIVRLSSKGRKVAFTTTLPIVRRHGYQGQLPGEVEAKAEPISRVLLAACRWKHHLYSSPSRSLWRDQVHVEFFRLHEVEDNDGFSLERNNSPKMNVGNKVVIEVAPNDLYGLEIKNRTRKKLYLSLLVFQIDDLSIGLHNGGSLGTQSDGGADPSLTPDSSLQIGCGDGGGLPFKYELRGVDVDVTILKLYLTTKPESLDWLQQESPFDSKVRHQLTAEEISKRQKSPDQWDTILFAVEQHRRGRQSFTSRTSRRSPFKNPDDSGRTFEYLLLTFSGIGVVCIFVLFVSYLNRLDLG